MKKIVSLVFLLCLLSFSYSIKISEVYFDWYDEYLWIYNETNNIFSWQLTISWAKSSNIDINVQIPSKTEIIIWDKDIEKYFSWYKPFTTWLSLSISDTSSINIEILDTSWQVLDKFKVPEDLVNKYNNKNTSFEKFFYNTGENVQTVQTWVNNNPSYTINPWFVYDFTVSEDTNTENTNQIQQDTSTIQYLPILCKVKYSKNWETYNLNYTWNFQSTKVEWYINNKYISSWNNLSVNISWSSLIQAIWFWSWFSCTWTLQIDTIDNSQSFFTWSLKITEIHSKIDIFPEYIELQAKWNFSWNVIFSWLGRGDTNWQTQITLYSWNYLVIAKELSGFKNSNIKIYSSMSLLDNWEKLQILSLSWEILFETNYPEISKDKSYYSDNKTENLPTPWFWLDFLNYYQTQSNQQTVPTCQILLQSQDITSDNKLRINFDSNVSDSSLCSDSYKQIWTHSWQVLSTWTCNPYYFYFPIWTWNITFQIQDLSGNIICSNTYNYIYTQQKVTQTITNTTYLDPTPSLCVSKLNSYELTDLVELVKNKYSETTTKRIFEPIKNIYIPKDWNYTKFFNSRQLRQLVDQTMSKYSINTLKYIFKPTKSLFDNYNISNNINQYNKTWTIIKILKILPNPKWKDTKEILVLSWIYTSWLNLRIDNKKYKLNNPLFSWNLIIFSWNLHLKNKWACLSLIKNNLTYDYKCYWQSKEGKWIDKFSQLPQITQQNIKSKDIKITFSGENILIYVDKQLIKHIPNKPLKNLIKKIKKAFKQIEKVFRKLQKTNKKLNKLYIKQLEKSSSFYHKYENYKAKYEKLKLEKSKKYKKYLDSTKKKSKQIKNLKNQISYLKSVIQKIKSKIDKNTYQKYLQLYKKVKLWMKIKFSYTWDGM